jgi:hypothetical protein
MGWVVNTMPRLLYPLENPGTYCTGGWVGRRAGLDRCGKFRPHRDIYIYIYTYINFPIFMEI